MLKLLKRIIANILFKKGRNNKYIQIKNQSLLQYIYLNKLILILQAIVYVYNRGRNKRQYTLRDFELVSHRFKMDLKIQHMCLRIFNKLVPDQSHYIKQKIISLLKVKWYYFYKIMFSVDSECTTRYAGFAFFQKPKHAIIIV